MPGLDRELFPLLEPPRGGRARLMARLAAREREPRRRRITAWAFAATAVALALLALTLRGGPDPAPRPSTALLEGVTHPALVAWGHEPHPTQPVTAQPSSPTRREYTRIPTSDDRVILYIDDP